MIARKISVMGSTGSTGTSTMAVGGLISLFAQFGDLFESRLKRRHGVKDSGGLVPGHGGVMDRVDGFGTAAVLAVLVFAIFPDLGLVLGGVRT